ncbi:MAG: SAM-dependent methyltransferase [Dehalococcoidia bacterium]
MGHDAEPQTPRQKADWTHWHRAYDDPSSYLARRLEVVQEQLRLAIDGKAGRLRMVSMCAGQARDVVGALAGHARSVEIEARLVELDPGNVDVAWAGVCAAGLDGIDVVCADAGVSDSYAGAVPADIILACGVFGNIPDGDVRRTIEFLPHLSAPGAVVIWTRGREPERDFPLTIRGWFAECGFEELAFVAPSDARFRVGVHRLEREPRPFQAGVRLFSFLW